MSEFTGSPRSTAPAPTLDTIQKWMQAVITHPGGVSRGVNHREAQELIAVAMERLDDVILPSRACSSVERLSVYAHAYYARLLECLRLEYPAFRYAVGEEAFESFALGYLQEYPSVSYTLGNLGARFPEAIAKAAAEFPVEGYKWPQLIEEIAWVERTYEEVFDGPGEERSGSLSAERLLSIPSDRIGDLQFVTSQSLRLLGLQFPVHEYISSVRAGETPGPPVPRETWLVINRRDYVVRRRTVSYAEYLVLDSLQQGLSFSDAIEICLAEVNEPIDEVAGRLQTWFRDWTAAGFFRDCRLVESPSSRQ